MNFKKKWIIKSVYVIPTIVALIKIRSWGTPIFFAAWCTHNDHCFKTRKRKVHSYNC